MRMSVLAASDADKKPYFATNLFRSITSVSDMVNDFLMAFLGRLLLGGF
jgi:hypothetical protein